MKSNTNSLSQLAGVSGRRLLTPDGLIHGQVRFQEGRVQSVQTYGADALSRARMIDAGDLLILPGIVDLHGDAFERAVMPRPGVMFPYDNALADIDRQLLANGITSEFHGVTLSWEGGLRGETYALKMFEALERMRARLGAHHHVHLRFETHHVAGVGIAEQWIQEGRVQFLALNDHLPSMVKRLGDDRKLLQYAERAQCDLDTYTSRVHRAMESSEIVPAAMQRLVACARAAGLQIASHDDPDADTRDYYHGLGCNVAEFPLTVQAAQAGRSFGNAVVFGAPNVVRGGSHVNAPDAAEMVRVGLCDILTSDYYYPAPLIAALQMAQRHAMPLPQAWRLVSRNPARAAGLIDLGELSVGARADAILVDDSVPGVPRVCATIVDGVIQYADRAFGLNAAIETASLAA